MDAIPLLKSLGLLFPRRLIRVDLYILAESSFTYELGVGFTCLKCGFSHTTETRFQGHMYYEHERNITRESKTPGKTTTDNVCHVMISVFKNEG